MEEKCKVWGCTNDNACEGGCYWVAEHLCSSCLDKILEENKKLKQWDVNKDTRNSRQRIANANQLKIISQQKELLDKIYQCCNGLVELLADVEHKRWSNWQKYLHNLCVKNEDGSLTIPKERVKHWELEIATDYKNLPENIKEYDRIEARKSLEVIQSLYPKEDTEVLNER